MLCGKRSTALDESPCYSYFNVAVSVVFAAGHEASEGNGTAGEKPERTVGETGEVQRAGTSPYTSSYLPLLYASWPASHSSCH